MSDVGIQKSGNSKGYEPNRNKRARKNSRHRIGEGDANRVVNKEHGDRRQKRLGEGDVKDKERHHRQKEKAIMRKKIKYGT